MAKKFNLGYNLGAGLLNEASKSGKQSQEFDIVMLPLTDLVPNKDNEKISVEDIEALAQSILDSGLQQNYVVVPLPDGKYKIVTGHRRQLACQLLVDRGHSEWTYVPCIIEDTSKIKLKLSEKNKERLLLLTTNTQQRNATLSDKIEMLKMANEIYDELKENGEPVGQRRKWLAEHLNISDSQVQITDYIDGHAAPVIKKEIEANRISPAVANEIAHLTTEEQQEFHAEKGKELPDMKAAEVGAWKKNREIKKTALAAKKENLHVLTADLLSVSKKQIDTQLNKLEHGLEVTDTEYQNLLKMQEKIERTLEKMNSLLVKAEVRKKKEPLS